MVFWHTKMAEWSSYSEKDHCLINSLIKLRPGTMTGLKYKETDKVRTHGNPKPTHIGRRLSR